MRTTFVVALSIVIALLAQNRSLIRRANTVLHLSTSPPAPTPYTHAKWRLAPEKLSDTVVAVSHILLRFDGLDLEPPGMRIPVRPKRSRDETLKLAYQLADGLRRDPTKFGEYAAKYSDDASSASAGGQLGLWPAIRLPREALDALATLNEHEFSRVIATPIGYEILRRDPTPPEESIGWRQIVIAYTGCNVEPRRPGREVVRTREQALTLTSQLYQQLVVAPERFPEIASTYSDHYTAPSAGYMGTWSNYRPEAHSTELRAAEATQINDVAPPTETEEGFKIVQRVPPKLEEQYAASVIEISFTRNDPTSVDHAAQVASSIMESVIHDPKNFEVEQRQRCCIKPIVWVSPRGPYMLESTLKSLAIGELYRSPVKSLHTYFIVRRVAVPEDRRSPTPVFTILQQTETPNIEFLVSKGNGKVLSQVADDIDRRARTDLLLTGNTDREFVRLTAQLRSTFENGTQSERLSSFRDTEMDLATLLGPFRYDKYMNIIHQRVTEELMRN